MVAKNRVTPQKSRLETPNLNLGLKKVKMATKFNMATKNHVTPQNLWLRTPNLNLGPKSQNGRQIQHGHQKSCDTLKFMTQNPECLKVA